MNTIIENMITRRSIRKFKPDMLPKETIDEIITAGTYARNGELNVKKRKGKAQSRRKRLSQEIFVK